MIRLGINLDQAAKPLLLCLIGVSGFHASYSGGRFGWIAVFLGMLIFLYALARLPPAVPSARGAFYAGLAVGLGIYGPHLGFFWSIFGPPAVSLWTVLALWIGLFVMLAHLCQRRFGPLWAAILMPFLWTGLEYFRSELYYLRFTWMSVGFAFSGISELPSIAWLGVYGIGFVVMCVASVLALMRLQLAAVSAAAATLVLALLSSSSTRPVRPPDQGTLTVAGVQAEFPAGLEVPDLLDKALKQCPEAQLFMLSEYTFDGPVPNRVRDWCKKNQRYLVAGGKDDLSSSQFYDTAFVIGPTGEIVFQQAKSVPIQFFKDGLPAKERRPWNSPWGKLGICICYDLSYSPVTDDLARQGIRALLVPTMDVLDWGRHEHDLHARVAPMCAAEYGIPIFRVASSGVSQLVNRAGQVSSSIPFAEEAKAFSGELDLSQVARLPIDRYLAPVSTALTALGSCWLVVAALQARRRAAPAGKIEESAPRPA